MQALNLKPTHKLVKDYYATLGQFGQLEIDHEMAVRSAFQALLRGCGRQFDWTLVPEYAIQKPKARPIKVDGAMVDAFRLARGFWEAKDEHDDLEKEINAKFERGYPKSNIIFQAPERAILFQNGIRQGLNEDLRDGENLVELLKVFFSYKEPHHEEWEAAVAEFKTRVPELAKAVEDKIEQQRRTNKAFVQTFDAFYDLCRQAINPNLSAEAVEKMLVQHLLTERIFRKIFDNPEFARRNVIAVEIEKVIDSLTAKQFSRDAFLKDLDRFYKAIELAAENAQDYSEKQKFINTVYERFFQGYSPNEADTHGIVYTPQPIVDFMVRSVEDILQKEFGRSLSDKGVHILDPFVGTGNFITRVMKEIKTGALPYKYENELHCNEVMLLPYYVASMNVEHEYMERTGEYKPFPGICLVDTFELAEPEQATLSFMTEENTDRVRRQKESPVFVVIGNPPYNVGQTDESEENKNRKYPALDRRIAETYTADSSATLRNKLSDPYVRAFRWASDRIGQDGVVAFVTNSSFVDQVAFDGMRHHLLRDFQRIHVLDLGGNVRRNPKLSGTTHNVFGIQVGVSITLLVRSTNLRNPELEISYGRVGDFWRKEEKYRYLDAVGSLQKVQWEQKKADPKDNWLTDFEDKSFDRFLPLVLRGTKHHEDAKGVVFGLFSLGVVTNRDRYAYNFSREELERRMATVVDVYNGAVDRLARGRSSGQLRNVDDVVDADDRRIKWTRQVKNFLDALKHNEFDSDAIRSAVYRPYCKQLLYFDDFWNEEQYQNRHIFPCAVTANVSICSPSIGGRTAFWSLATNEVTSLTLTSLDGTQCFPFYTYDEDGRNRRENITDWALNEFRTHYGDRTITKWDIFHYVYAVLHHPEYRTRYAANLKRELPRIPYVKSIGGERGPSTLVAKATSAQDDTAKAGPSTTAAKEAAFAQDDTRGISAAAEEKQIPRGLKPARDESQKIDAGRGPEGPLYRSDAEVFRAFAAAGKRLADLHVNYEQQPEFPLERVEKGQLNYRVEKMRLSKDKSTIVYNDFLTLKGIPPETYEYRLGNRSALEWVVDQYQVSTDKRSGIVNDPNREDDPEYIVRLIGRVVTVSLETMKLVKSLPEWAVDVPDRMQ